MTQIYDVIVIGCGAAGVAAVNRLVEKGVKVLGLEANNYIGGRISTESFGNSVIDLGAQFCHGEQNNAVYSLIKDLDVVSPPSGHRKLILFKSNGSIYSEAESKPYLDLCASIVDNARTETPKHCHSLASFIRNRYQTLIRDVPNLNNDLSGEILEWYKLSTQIKMSTNELLEKSFDSVKESWDNQGEQWLNWRDRGYKTLIDVLLKSYPDSSKTIRANILCDKEVTNIKWSNSLKSIDKNSSLVQVKCRDGSLYEAKHAIITTSVGVLMERYEKLFTPALPEDKILSIRCIAMCTMNKIYMRFSDRWWPDTMMRMGLLWNNADRAKFNNEYDEWLAGVYEITTVEMQPKLLCAWLVGNEAMNMETCSSEMILDGMHRLLNHFLGKYKVTRPVEVKRSEWFRNSLTRGSFSYRSVETECVNKGAQTLSEPLTNGSGVPIVCFAGEATSHHHYSTVHGAVESGFREAERLIASIK